MSPTERSLNYLRKHGVLAAKVEHHNSFSHKRHDLFGFADLIAVSANRIALIQVTTASNMAARRKKIKAEPRAKQWLDASPCTVIELHGWQKKGKHWHVKVEEITDL